MHKTPLSPKKWNKATEKDLKSSDWVKDSSDKFYSLTEESALSSGEHSFSESSSGETSEAGNKSSSNEPTVRQLRRQRKCTKPRPCSQEDPENSTSTGGRTLKWDYSGISLTDSPTTNDQGSVNNNMEGNIGGPASNMCVAGTEAGMLQPIYNSIKELQTETRIESRRARVATKRLQGTVHIMTADEAKTFEIHKELYRHPCHIAKAYLKMGKVDRHPTLWERWLHLRTPTTPLRT
ncbi:hypothetical protein NDU88_001753 [Pleurodeles waltl]|uniref:Uncharacterized protein n=1 Tax=Pleurodeles waltl TaxID=8319 RepID=A0AAV7S8Y3_PLEWA|nr:hypothetical protein NDU88_001753 [Pleurodeles waltl]